MIQEQFDVLQKCIDKGYAKNIEVHYNTNGTHYPEYAVKEIWPHFKRVEMAFSIDDINGFLIGTSSLDAKKFYDIYRQI